MGVCHHSNYFAFFEMGRTELLRANGLRYRELEDQGLLMVVVKATCSYKLPARYDDLVRLTTRTKRVTAAKIEHEYELTREGLLLAVGETTLACVDREGRVQRVPAWLREASEVS